MLQWRKPWLGVVLPAVLAILTACGGAAPAAPAPAATTAPAAAVEPTQTAAPAAEEAAAPDENRRTFAIDPEQSVVRFTLTELLMGEPKTVVGESRAVAGGVTVDLADYANTTLDPIQIDADSFATDNNFRDRAIRRYILQTGNPESRYITFTPTAVTGLPETAAMGSAFDFTVTGDLTIRGTTQPVTFAVSVTPTSETELRGTADTTVPRGDFDLQIPDVPSVANVSDEVQLAIDFVAVAQ